MKRFLGWVVMVGGNMVLLHAVNASAPIGFFLGVVAMAVGAWMLEQSPRDFSNASGAPALDLLVVVTYTPAALAFLYFGCSMLSMAKVAGDYALALGSLSCAGYTAAAVYASMMHYLAIKERQTS